MIIFQSKAATVLHHFPQFHTILRCNLLQNICNEGRGKEKGKPKTENSAVRIELAWKTVSNILNEQ